jgi:hypothetical protein
MSVFRKLPPDVARELRRHVSPRPLPKPGQKNPEVEQKRKGMSKVLAGCIALTTTAASFPLVASWWITNLNAKEDPLTAPQVRRGAFTNSGSRDVGIDTNWDFNSGQYKKDTGYVAISEEGKKKPLPAEFLAMPAGQLTEKHEKEIEAFAKGGRKHPRRE